MSYPAIVFPDAEQIAIDHLLAQLALRANSTPVTNKVPDQRPTKFATCRRLGGPRRNLVADNAQIGVECWAATDPEAHDLAQLCRALLLAMAGRTIDGHAVYQVEEFAGPVNLPDPESAQSRYTFTVQISVRGAAA